MRPILNLWLRWTEKRHLTRVKDPETLRKSFELKARLFFRAPRGTKFRDDVLTHEGARVAVHWARAPGVGEGPVILYFHGGGYVFGSPRTHRAMLARLSQMTGLTACLPKYRLGPDHAFPAAIDDALTAYGALMDHPGGVVLGGDSAGGGLTLALLGEITRQGLKQPLGCFAFSPLTDLTFSGESFVRNAEADVELPAVRAPEMGQMYLQGADAKDPRASPLHAGFKGAAAVWLTAGDTEILLDDTRRMADVLKAQGVAVTCKIENDLPHVWPLLQGLLPEARQTLAELADWIKALSRPKSDS